MIIEPKKGGPTYAVVEYARTQPGGVIRWGDAASVYLKTTSSSSGGGWNYSLQRILDRYFTRVFQPLSDRDARDVEEDYGGRIDVHLPWRPLRGYYVLDERLHPEPITEEILEEPDVDADGTHWYFMYSMTQLIEALDIFQN